MANPYLHLDFLSKKLLCDLKFINKYNAKVYFQSLEKN